MWVKGPSPKGSCHLDLPEFTSQLNHLPFGHRQLGYRFAFCNYTDPTTGAVYWKQWTNLWYTTQLPLAMMMFYSRRYHVCDGPSNSLTEDHWVLQRRLWDNQMWQQSISRCTILKVLAFSFHLKRASRIAYLLCPSPQVHYPCLGAKMVQLKAYHCVSDEGLSYLAFRLV